MERTRNRLSEMEQTLRELSGSIMGIASLDPKDFNIRAFDKVLMGEKEGIGVYYPMFRDGSCAEAEYFKFRTYPKYVIIEKATSYEYEKARLEKFLRR
jgi:hypothetical protein